MSTEPTTHPHRIAELLSAGVEPTADEAAGLARLGTFAATLYARMLHGIDPLADGGVGAGPQVFAGELTGRMSADTGSRWLDGIGIGATIASEMLGGVFAADYSPAEGYFRLDAGNMDTIDLIEDEAPVAEPVQETARRRRPSLFGRKRQAGARGARRAARAARASGRRRTAAGSSTELSWAHGGTIAPAAAAALETGGLFIADQLAPANRTPQVATAGSASAVGAMGRGAGRRVRKPITSVSLDGLLIDDRTPALAGALSLAEAAFGLGDQPGAGLAVTTAGLGRLLQSAPQESVGSSRGGQRPVFGFFDSVEGDFLSLTPEVARQSAPVVSEITSRPPRRVASMFASDRVSSRQEGGTAAAAAPVTPARVPEAGSGQRVVQASLSNVVTPSGRAATQVRPFTGGVFRQPAPASPTIRPGQPAGARGAQAPNPGSLASLAPLFARRVTYDQAGRARVAVERGSVAAPRAAVTTARGLASTARASSAVAQAGVDSATTAGLSAATHRGIGPRLGHQVGVGESMMIALDARTHRAAGTSADLAPEASAAFDGAAVESLAHPAAPIALPAGGPVEARGLGAGHQWRLAADLGPDLPLGAALSRHEAVAGEIVMRRGATASVGETFAPIVSRPFADPMASPASAAAQMSLDGVAWVSLPVDHDGPAPSRVSADRLRLAAVPTGRRASQVPAASIVRGSVLGAQMAASAVPTPVQSIPPQSTPSQSVSDRLVPAGAPLHVGIGGQIATSFIPPLARAQRAPDMIRATGAVSGGQAVSPSSTPVGLQLEVAEVPGLGVADGGLASAAAAATRFARSGMTPTLSGFDAQGWSRAADRSAAAAVGRGTYAHAGWDLDAAVVQLSNDARTAPIAGDEAGTLRRVARRAASRSGAPTPAIRPVVSAEQAAGAHESWAQRVSPPVVVSDAVMERVTPAVDARGAAVAVRAAVQLAGAGRHAEARAQLATLRAAGIDVSLPDGAGALTYQLGGTPAASPWARTAREARTALRRPVLTAREILQAAPLMAATGPIAGPTTLLRAGLDSGPRAGGSQALGRRLSNPTAAHGPALLRQLDGRRVVESLSQLGLDTGADGAGLLSAIAELPVTEGLRVREMLRVAGWQPEELQMLSLPASAGREDSDAGAPAADRRTRTAPGMFGDRAADADSSRPTMAGAADARRLTRNLARLVTGTEALSTAAPASGGIGATPTVSVEALLGGTRPIVATSAVDQYFEGTAPSRGRATFSSALRDAVGELVAIAEASSAGERAVAPEARASVVRRLQIVRDAIRRAGAAGRITLPSERALGLEIDAERGVTTAVAAIGRQPLADRVGELADRGEAGAQLPPLAASVVETHEDTATAGIGERGYDELLSRGDLDVVGLASEIPAFDDDFSGDTGSRTGLGRRLGEALASSARGPAGAARLTRSLASRTAAGGRTARRASAVVPSTDERAFATLGTGAGPVSLGAVVAPEAMLSGMKAEGLRAERFTQPGQGPAAGGYGREVPGELTGLTAEAAAAAPPTRVAPDGKPRKESLFDRPQAASEAQASARVARRAPGARAAAQLAAIVGGDSGGTRLIAMLDRASSNAGTSSSGLLHGLLRRLGDTASGDFSQVLSSRGYSGGGAMADFALAWLGRVDGNRTGLDIGLDDTRVDISRVFGRDGRTRESAAAFDSPIADAAVVAPQDAATPGDDRSGLRSIARAMAARRRARGGAARRDHGAAQAFSQANWKFVETGSRESATHVDLGGLAAQVLNAPGAGDRVPMPLVAPAVKAVAQTALRKGRSEDRGGSTSSQSVGDGAAAQGDSSQQGEATLSNEAFEALALEMADRLAIHMKREQERKGIWP